VHEVHFFLVDHGGAVVVGHALSADEARAAGGEVLVVDDISSFLSRRLVADLHASGRRVLGVFDPGDQAAGEDRLRELGVDDTIASDSPAEAFVAAITSLAGSRASHGPVQEAARTRVPDSSGRVVAVAAASGGAGATEVALALATLLCRRDGATVLADVDEVTPSIAQRRGFPVHPNLLTAVEAVQHGNGSLRDCLLPDPLTGLRVLGGLPNPRLWHELRPDDVVAVVREVARRSRVVVANTGSRVDEVPVAGVPGRFAVSRAVIGMADVVAVVATASPIGVSRLIDWLANAGRLVERAEVHLVINSVPSGGYRSAQIAEEMLAFADPASITMIRSDPVVARAAWQGAPVGRGPFRRSVARLAGHIGVVAEST
jgi:MinD-like ATPase involved in chromosome partitioning or flagellar assembly